MNKMVKPKPHINLHTRSWKLWQEFTGGLPLKDFKKVRRCIRSIEKQLFN